MGEFNSDLMLMIARTADSRRRILPYVSEDSQFYGSYFDSEALFMIEEFKDAIFAVLMYRAHLFMKQTNQDDKAEGERGALSRVTLELKSGNIAHKTDDSGFQATGGIGRVLPESELLNDNEILEKFLNIFIDSNRVSLACG